MVVRVSETSSLYKFPMGRAEFAMREVERRARSAGKADIANLARRGADEAQQAMGLRVRIQSGTRAKYPPEATAKDNEVDHCLSAFDGYLDVQIGAYPDEPRGHAARRIKKTLLPNGVGEISGLSFAEEHAAVNNFLVMAADPELAADMSLLPEAADLLDRLRMRNTEFGVILNQSKTTPKRPEVVEAQAVAQDTLVATVCLIIGLYAQETPVNTVERDHLLEPILEQNATLRLLRRRRRTVTDVDPQTGEELTPDQSPGDAQNPDAAGDSGATE